MRGRVNFNIDNDIIFMQMVLYSLGKRRNSINNLINLSESLEMHEIIMHTRGVLPAFISSYLESCVFTEYSIF